MKISSGNSPAFGCGACAQLKKEAKIICPATQEIFYKGTQYAVKSAQKDLGVTHGEAASKILKTIRGVINRKA